MNKQLEFEFVRNVLALLSIDEIYATADESLLKQLTEDRRLDRKSSRIQLPNLAESLSMWANTAPDGGLLVVGQIDDGQFDGCNKLSAGQLNQLEKSNITHCPDARMKTRRVQVTNTSSQADFVLLLRIFYDSERVVRTNKGKVFARYGDTKKELSPELIRELEVDKGQLSFEREPCRQLKWPEDFDTESVSQFVRKVSEQRRIPGDRTREDVLELRKLGKSKDGQFHPNLACMLLFANDPTEEIPGCKVRFLRFDGETERTGERFNAVKDEIIEGNIPNLISEIEKILDSQLRTFSPLDRTGKFQPIPEYPKQAWYEAIVNACVHRSYGNGLKNVPIFVKMFDDRLVIESPGSFPPLVNSKNIFDSHHPRNPTLMDALFYMEYVRCAHEGTRRIRDGMLQMHLPHPEFRETLEDGRAVIVTLCNNVKQRRAWIDFDITKYVEFNVAQSLSEQEKQLLNAVAERTAISVSDAQKIMDVTWQTAHRALLELARKGLLQYVRYKPLAKNQRDPKAFFRLNSKAPLPDGAHLPSL